jgi:Mn-dependent DtxR family transcriptional regulator
MGREKIKDKELTLPSSIFRDRDLSVLEAIAEYLKDKKNLRYSEIAKLLNRDDRTIWTAYTRAKEKRGVHE